MFFDHLNERNAMMKTVIHFDNFTNGYFWLSTQVNFNSRQLMQIIMNCQGTEGSLIVFISSLCSADGNMASKCDGSSSATMTPLLYSVLRRSVHWDLGHRLVACFVHVYMLWLLLPWAM
jgi:hypothetical protein